MNRKTIASGIQALAITIAACVASPTVAQQCPRPSETGPSIDSELRTLTGQLVYHDGIRRWFELRLDEPTCGYKSIQANESGDDNKELESLRGCRVESSGRIAFSPTGYYSLLAYQSIDKIQPLGSCTRQQPFPDDAGLKPDPQIRAYRVDMSVNYRPGDHPIIFHVRSGGKELQPWRAYASYLLTGGQVLYGDCGEGFVVDRVFGTRQARPEHFEWPRTPEDKAAFDPYAAARAGVRDLHLVYTCVRGSAQKPDEP